MIVARYVTQRVSVLHSSLQGTTSVPTEQPGLVFQYSSNAAHDKFINYMHSSNYKHPKTALNGIIQYLSTNKYWSHKGNQFYDPMRELNRIMLGFFRYYSVETKGIMRSKKMIALEPAAKVIQSRFSDFKDYLKAIN